MGEMPMTWMRTPGQGWPGAAASFLGAWVVAGLGGSFGGLFMLSALAAVLGATVVSLVRHVK